MMMLCGDNVDAYNTLRKGTAETYLTLLESKVKQMLPPPKQQNNPRQHIKK